MSDKTDLVNTGDRITLMMKRFLRIPNRVLYAILRSLLALLEQEHRKLASSERGLAYPSIFIVGTPRSGTTLLYQLMVHHFHLAYFPGIANKFYTSPVFAAKWGLRHCKPYVSDFTSNYGLIEDPMAPHEAGAIWNRWYPTERVDGYNYTPAGYFDEKTEHIIYQTIAGIEKSFDAPFINKNVKHSVRIESLVKIFPKALFIQIKRNLFDIANSLLIARKQITNDVNAWLSVMPKQVDSLRGKDYLEQICGQVFYVEQNIEEDIALVGRERLYVTHYETLCEDPRHEIDQISTFVKSHRCNLLIKHEIPESFKRAQHKKETLNDEQKTIMEILDRYYGQNNERLQNVS